MSTLDIARLTVAERLDLMARLWDSLSAEELTAAQQAELARRAFEIADGDLEWTRPYLEEAIAEAERGEVVTLDELEAHLDARFGRLET